MQRIVFGNYSSRELVHELNHAEDCCPGSCYLSFRKLVLVMNHPEELVPVMNLPKKLVAVMNH